MNSYATVAVALILAPLLQGIIGKTKALVGGRIGPPWLQPYWDLTKLLRKGATYSTTTTWLFRAGPMVGLACVLHAGCFIPLGSIPGPFACTGDILIVAALLALARFATILAALDTGSAFEGMGASREATLAVLAEPTLLVGLTAVAWTTGAESLAEAYGALSFTVWLRHAAPLLLIAGALAIVVLAENARIPVDDPATHLELTMIHEVMVLDHSGPDFAFILYGASLKLWFTGALLVGLLVPTGGLSGPHALAAGMVGMVGLAVAVGLVESSMARLRLTRLPQFLVGAVALAVFGLMLVMR